MTRLAKLEKAEFVLDNMRRTADAEEYEIERSVNRLLNKVDIINNCGENFSCFNYLALGARYIDEVRVTGLDSYTEWRGVTCGRNARWYRMLKAHNNILDALDYERNASWYEECSSPYRFKGEEGLYFHVVNRHVKDWEDYISKFAGIDGEVCTSKITDTPMKRRHNFIGLLLRGTPTASFPFDCWSQREPRGRFRVATRKEFDSLRNEFWVIPATCQIKAVVMRKFDKKVAEAAAALNLPIQFYNRKEEEYED